MKTSYVSLIIVSSFLGCAAPPAPKSYVPASGTASRALDIEHAVWDRTEARALLDGLIEKIRKEVSVSRGDVASPKTLATIHRTILREGFAIKTGDVRTFGDTLSARELDCSGLTLVYLEVLERFGADPHVAFGRDHILLAIPTGASWMYWETTEGRKLSPRALQQRMRIAPESVANGVYISPCLKGAAFATVYLEIALKLSSEGRKADAERMYRMAAERHPKLVTGAQSLAAFLAGQGRFAEAEPILLEAIRLDPTYPELYDFATQLYQSMGDDERALAMCEKAFKYGTTNERTLNSYVSLSLGKLF